MTVLAAVEEALVGMPPEFVHCRTYGHDWEPSHVERVPSGYEQVLMCVSCETEKIQHISRRGEIVSTSMRYVNGYLLKGLGRMTAETRALARVASLEHILAGSTPVKKRRKRRRS